MNEIKTASTLTIYDNFGRKIAENDFTNTSLKINIPGFIPGVYTYALSLNNRILNSGTFIKN